MTPNFINKKGEKVYLQGVKTSFRDGKPVYNYKGEEIKLTRIPPNEIGKPGIRTSTKNRV